MRKCYADISATNKAQHSATKAKDMEGNLPPIDLLNAPPGDALALVRGLDLHGR